ncbi:MAG: cytochrome c biogenesis protein CcsA [Planctomycetes bacterium]|nr:cytochrome c biogenesis protein CcsA [Planctomycetota bacterium]
MEELARISTLVLTGLTVGGYLLAFLSGGEKFKRMALPFHSLLFVLFTLYISVYSLRLGRCPIASGREVMIFSAWILTGLMLLNELLCERRSVAVFVLPFSALATFIPILSEGGPWLPEKYIGTLFPLHVGLTAMGFVLYSLVFLLCLLYTKSFRDIKNKRPGPLFGRIPPLKTQETQIRLLLAAGNLLVPAGLAFGIYWSLSQNLHEIVGPKLLVSLGAWTSFVVLMFRFRRLTLARILTLSTLGFLLVALSFFLGRHGA